MNVYRPTRVWSGKLPPHATVARMKPSKKQLQVLEVLKAANGPMTVNQLIAAIGDGKSSIRARLHDLQSMNLVRGVAPPGQSKAAQLWLLTTTQLLE
jgi:predicted transcriptional regulator